MPFRLTITKVFSDMDEIEAASGDTVIGPQDRGDARFLHADI